MPVWEERVTAGGLNTHRHACSRTLPCDVTLHLHRSTAAPRKRFTSLQRTRAERRGEVRDVYQPEFTAMLYLLKMTFVLKASMISWSSKTQNNIHLCPHHLRAVPWSRISRFVGMLSFKSSALIAIVTYAEHITWSRAINQVNFTLISWLQLSPHLVYQAVRQSVSMFQSIQFKVSQIWRAASN